MGTFLAPQPVIGEGLWIRVNKCTLNDGWDIVTIWTFQLPPKEITIFTDKMIKIILPALSSQRLNFQSLGARWYVMPSIWNALSIRTNGAWSCWSEQPRAKQALIFLGRRALEQPNSHSHWLTRPVYAIPHTLQVFSHPECTGCEWVLVYRHGWFQSLTCHLLMFYDVLRRPLAESLCVNAFYYFLVCDVSGQRMHVTWST